MNQAQLAQLIAENAQLSEQLRRLEDGPVRLQGLSSNAVHQVAGSTPPRGDGSMVTGLRSTARTLIKVNDKSAQVLGRRRNGTWQVDKNPPFDENAEVVIFVDPWAQECQESWGCAPAGFYIAPARETSEHPRPPRRIQGPARRPTSQKPPQQPQRDQLEHIRQWQDHWNAFS